ncbi:MAG: GDP-mannose 4,6-dehydratase, partial [Thermoguttaceae bacterium]
MRTILVTGGAGFIGSCFVRQCLGQWQVKVVNLDKMTYAGNLGSLDIYLHHPHHCFIQGDISDPQAVDQIIKDCQPDAIVHFAAESHVDRSIDDPAEFVRTNVQGTF